MAAMVVYSQKDIAELNKWVADVRRYAAPWQSQGEAGLPAVWKVSRKVNVPEIYRTLEASIKGRSWKAEELEQVAKAMALFSGPERQVRQNLRTSQQRPRPTVPRHWFIARIWLASPTLQAITSTWPGFSCSVVRIPPPLISHFLRSRAPQVGLDSQRLASYLTGVKNQKGKRSKFPTRWKVPSTLFAVADIIKSGRVELQQHLNLEAPLPQPTLMESIVMHSALQSDLKEVEAENRRVKDAKRKADGRVGEQKAARKAAKEAAKEAAKKAEAEAKKAVKAAQEAARLKYLARKAEVRRELVPHFKEVARNEEAGERGRMNTLRVKALRAKRAALDDLKKVEIKLGEAMLLSEKRLRRAEAAEAKLSPLKDELADMTVDLEHKLEICGDAVIAKRKYEAIGAKLELMPSWRPVATGRGRNVKFDFAYRRTVFELYSHGTPRSAIGPNILSIVSRTAPWLTPVAASPPMLIEMRFEMRTVVECLAGRDAAAAWRLRLLGSDEATKFGNPAITSNVVAEMTPGGELKVIVLRGVYCSSGGTAEAVATAIDTKCFGRLRDHLEGWRAQYEKMYPGEKWTGPDSSRLCLGRLGGGGALIGDTCNTAQKTKEILTGLIAAEVQESMGAEAWTALTEAQQKHVTRVHKLDCFQHLRNIFLNEMSKAQTAHVAEELKPWLDEFSSWDRITTDFTQLLRAAYKEFHHGNAYYKGKGREFRVWLKENYPKAFTLHFERAEGGRQDLDYDAAIPLYVMRPYMIEFLYTLVYGADHSNILEDFLYMSFRSVEYIAMTRANALIDLLVSRPLRWLSGNAYLLDNFSPLDMRVALGLVHDVFVKAADDGSVLLDPTLDIFKSIADTQPAFAQWRSETFEKVRNRRRRSTVYLPPLSAHAPRCSRVAGTRLLRRRHHASPPLPARA